MHYIRSLVAYYQRGFHHPARFGNEPPWTSA